MSPSIKFGIVQDFVDDLEHFLFANNHLLDKQLPTKAKASSQRSFAEKKRSMILTKSAHNQIQCSDPCPYIFQ